MKKVISFSLWGSDEKYSYGMVENAKLAAEIFPDWECWVYCPRHGGPFGPVEAWTKLDKMDNVKIIPVHIARGQGFAKAGWQGMFWRFEPAGLEDTIMISRDCDSRLSLREKEAVDEWLESDKGFHIMRDHPWHTSVIMGGMWGCRSNALPEFLNLMQSWNQEDRWQTDQEFLEAEIWPRITGDVFIHDSFYQHIPFLTLGIAKDFPSVRQNGQFVGQAFEADGSVNQEHIDMLSDGPLI